MKPILFNTEGVKAILNGRKTVTRRVVKKDKADAVLSSPFRMENPDIPDDRFIKCLCTAPCEIGDVLYVRETWNKIKLESESEWHYEYRASCENPSYFSNGFMAEWRPSIHMPKEAARIFLRVIDVRVERLQDMTDKDALKEGAQGVKCDHAVLGAYGCTDCMNTGWLEPPALEFVESWNSTIKKSDIDSYGWEANPWVWVIEFERIGREEAMSEEHHDD